LGRLADRKEDRLTGRRPIPSPTALEDRAPEVPVFGSLPQSDHLPCPACGVSLSHADLDEHVCDRERWLSYQIFQARDEIDSFDTELAAYLSSPKGAFELWYAERARRLAA
jgi:hypothetical protein